MTKQWTNNGFTLDGGLGSSGKEDANAILVDPLFKEAKNNNRESADTLWAREWNRNADANRKTLLDATWGAEEVVFISVPGTSRKNQIPLAASAFLSHAVGTKARFINGDKAFIPIHTSMMKSISRGERVFHPRVFEAHHSVFRAIRESCPHARFFVVEDLLTTGNSAHSFQRFLEKNGISVHGVIAMKGAYEPNVPPNLTKKIDKFFKQNNIPVDAEKLSLELTGKEAQTLAFQVIALYKNADEQHQQLFRDLFTTLYDIRVNDNHALLPKMDQLGQELSHYLTEKEKHHEKNSSTNQTTVPKVQIQTILAQHSTGKAGQAVPKGQTENGHGTATGTLRNDAGQRQHSGNNSGAQERGQGITSLPFNPKDKLFDR